MVKKTVFFAAAFALVSACVFSLSWNDIEFSAGASTDYYTGQIREIVYPDSGWKNQYLSELLWQIDNIAMLSGRFAATLNNFSLHVSGSTALNKGTGQMDDYDWGDSTITHWTNWSNSDIFLDKSFLLDASLTYSIKPDTTFSIPVGIGYKLNYLNWSDKLGKFIYYGTWNSNHVFYYFDPVNHTPETWNGGGTPGINYTFAQNILFLTSGIQYAKGPFTGSLNVSYSPLIYAWDLDHHLMNKLDGSGTFYIDSFTSHVWYRLIASAAYMFEHEGILALEIGFEELPEIKGNMQMYNEDSSDSSKIGSQVGYSTGGAGLASKILSISIGYTFLF